MNQLQDVSAQLDAKFGAPGTKSSKDAERKSMARVQQAYVS